MVMSMYALKDTTLTALGDAVRSKVGKTRTEEVPVKVPIKVELNTDTLIFDDSWKKANTSNNYAKQEVYCIDRVSKVKIIYSQTTNVLGGDTIHLFINNNPDIYNQSPHNLIKINQARGENLELYLNNTQGGKYLWITYDVTANSNTTPQWQTAVSAEIYPLDENGEVITTSPMEVKNTMTPLEMVDKINGLMTLPTSALNLTGSCMYKFASNGWNWFVEDYGDKVTTNGITDASLMFNNSTTLTKIPFDINLSKSAITLEKMFYWCGKLERIPNVSWVQMPTSTVKIQYIFCGCNLIKTIPDWFIELCEHNFNTAQSKGSWSDFGPFSNLFGSCENIREIPVRLMAVLWNPVATGNYYTLCYGNPFGGMYRVNELVNLPYEDIELTSNSFNNAYSHLQRLKRFTVITNEDGSPVVRRWKSQTFDFLTLVGYGSLGKLDDDKKVTDDVTYQALKNDPDYWTDNINYSRYNHDSAVETINSLPDTSAYLATKGGTNTIKFKGASGALTDGGAINTLTEEEIAVATAKGWTVTLS